MAKPELLLPVGNIEAFYAAIEGGADAIFIGLKSFNARGRATNFNNFQFLILLDEAHKNGVKVYVTLNTVIKNAEIPELLDTLWFLSKTKVDAVIIQDWGTYYFLRNMFPNLTIHASTQMANHNSAGLTFSKKLKFERVILARELTLLELESIQQKPAVETEIFVHGALCYSFSGMCLYSSYLGGAGANRGLCTQPCRRYYKNGTEDILSFSLKDNQLAQHIPTFGKLGISSLKIEGRIKSGEYVYQVAKTYRKILDKKIDANAAKQELKLDMGREKTEWFFSNDVGNALTEKPNTGLKIGSVEKITSNGIVINSDTKLEAGNRIRIATSKTKEQLSVKIQELTKIGENRYEIAVKDSQIKEGNELYLASLGTKKFPNKLKGNAKRVQEQMPFGLKAKAQSKIRNFKNHKKETIFVRINSLDWLRKINLNEVDQLIIQLTKKEFEEIDLQAPFLQKNKHKIWFELPQFISEKHISFYKKVCNKITQFGFRNFSLSHLSQKEFLPKDCRFLTNENVYCYNDAAAQTLYNEDAQWITCPFENEYENLLRGGCRSQIIPVYFFPKLFFSRQPVKIGAEFKDDKGQSFRKEVRDGITIVVPEKPVAILQFYRKLTDKGFNQFLIDLSFTSPSKHVLKRLTKKLHNSEQEQPSGSFNFKKGLK